MQPPSLTRYAWLSIAAAIATMLLKSGAYLLTGSVGLLSDALESLVNLAGALMALAMLTVAARPPDEDHAYGHGKAENISALAQALLLLGTCVWVVHEAMQRLTVKKVELEVTFWSFFIMVFSICLAG